VNTVKRHRNGYSLLEVMFVIGVLGFVALVATQIFVNVNQTTLKTVQRQTAQMRFDQAVRRLRVDVWNAAKCTLQNPQQLQIFAGNKSVNWTVGSTINRQADSEVNTWDELQSNFHFEAKGDVVTIVQDPVAGDSGGRVSLLEAAAFLKGPAQ
jgi:prepilin-type N-terminal cleavage/methylation domain-containing protein